MSLADCCGCATRDDELESGTVDAAAPFTIGVKGIEMLNQPGKEDENKAALAEVGGTQGLVAALCCDAERGISGTPEDLAARLAAFGENRFPAPPFESWWSLFFSCFSDVILIILILASIVSLIIGTIEHPDYGFVDGLAIMIAVFIVAAVTATNDYNKQLQFRALDTESKARIEVQVVRGGERVALLTNQLLVGDIVHIETGAKIPADGYVLAANDLKCNESALTGESDDIKKDPVHRPTLMSGAQVSAGTCDYIVTGVGVNSLQGAIMKDVAQEAGETPLQVKLALLATRIGYVGAVFAVATFVAMMLIKATGGQASKSWQSWTTDSFLYAVTIIVVAIPEGLPLAVTISLAYSTRKMLADNNLIRVLAACETMGGATDICSDKTGTLTENRMTVVQAWLGGRIVEFASTEPHADGATSANLATVPAPLRELLVEHLSLNATATVGLSSKGKREVAGSKTEGAGVMLVESMGASPPALRKAASDGGRVLKQYAFSSDRKMMSTLVARPGGGVRLYTTGGSDFILARCAGILQLGDAAAPEAAATAPPGAHHMPMTPALSESIVSDVIVAMARQSLRTLGVAYRDFPSRDALPGDYEAAAPEEGLTLYAVLGIKDPLRPDVADAVASCQAAGVMVRMVTGDNKITATAIARECGILRDGGLVVEGPVFRGLTPDQLDMILPRLAVMARSSPKDKNILVRRLNGNLPATRAEWEVEHPGADWDTERDVRLPGYRESWAAARRLRGHVYKAVVGVTGDGTNDAPALKAADVGLSMGISGTQVAMDASDIIILDDRFSSIVRAVLWGRSVYDNVQKFLQFQLTVNVVALWVTFLAACMSQEPPLNPVMMLWVNLIMDVMGALALGTEEPSITLLDRKPYASTASLVSPQMWRHILVISAYQLAMMLTLLQRLVPDFGITEDFLLQSGRWISADGPVPDAMDVAMYRSTFIFNAFVFAQIFNEINSRSLTNNWNVYKGLLNNSMFMGVILLSAGVQAIIVEFGQLGVKTTGLTSMHWCYTVLLGAIALPLGILMRFIPVPARPSDFADHFQSAFYQRMNEKAARELESGVVGGGGMSDEARGAVKAAPTAAAAAPEEPVKGDAGGDVPSPAVEASSASTAASSEGAQPGAQDVASTASS